MDSHVFAAVILAALLHAGWNAVVKVGLDRVPAMVLLAGVQAAIALPILPFVARPAPEAWAWIAFAAALHCGYKIFLLQAYRHTDLSLAYPLARGTAPAIVLLVSLTLLAEPLTWPSILAVAAISLGVVLMTRTGHGAARLGGRALFFALGTAVFTASYTLVDGYGARVAGTASGFILWMVIGDALGMAGYAWLARGGSILPAMTSAWRTGVLAGAMSLGSYWIAVWAFTAAPIALVAALRESSILFAVMIAAFVLKEPVDGRRWLSAGAIAAGVALIKL